MFEIKSSLKDLSEDLFSLESRFFYKAKKKEKTCNNRWRDLSKSAFFNSKLIT